MFNLAKNSPEKEWRNRPKTKPVSEPARDRFLHSRPWQYGVTPDATRKFRIVVERMRRLARTLARVDKSGNCRQIFPSVNTILARLNEAEANYPERQRFKWSRRSVFVYLKRLEAARIATAGGLSTYHGTRRRELHPDMLLSVPRESCTTTRRESCTGSKSLSSWKLHRSGNRRIETHKRAANNAARNAPAALPKHSNSNPQTKPSCSGNGQSKPRTIAGPLPSCTIRQLREPIVTVYLLNLLATRYPEGIAYPERWPMDMLVWVLRDTEGDPDCEREIFHPGGYVRTCIDHFLRDYPEDWRREVILRRFCDLPGVHFDKRRRRWVMDNPPASKPSLPPARAVRFPKTIEKARRRDELERNPEPAQAQVESEWDRALRYREWCAAKAIAVGEQRTVIKASVYASF
jgi:hypothetical protein